MLNEFANMIMMYHLICVSDFYTNIEVRYSVIGKSFIVTTIFNVVLNSLVIIVTQYRILRGNWIKN